MAITRNFVAAVGGIIGLCMSGDKWNPRLPQELCGLQDLALLLLCAIR
jgi:hypothetical protein